MGYAKRLFPVIETSHIGGNSSHCCIVPLHVLAGECNDEHDCESGPALLTLAQNCGTKLCDAVSLFYMGCTFFRMAPIAPPNQSGIVWLRRASGHGRLNPKPPPN